MKKLFLVLGFMAIAGVAIANPLNSNTPKVIDTTLTSAAPVSYTLSIPDGTTQVALQAKTAAAFEVSSSSSEVNITYYTVKSGTVYVVSNINARNTELYLTSTTAGLVVEALCWK